MNLTFPAGVLTRVVNVPVKLTFSLWAPALSFQSLAVSSVAQPLILFLKLLNQLVLRKLRALLFYIGQIPHDTNDRWSRALERFYISK